MLARVWVDSGSILAVSAAFLPFCRALQVRILAPPHRTRVPLGPPSLHRFESPGSLLRGTPPGGSSGGFPWGNPGDSPGGVPSGSPPRNSPGFPPAVIFLKESHRGIFQGRNLPTADRPAAPPHRPTAPATRGTPPCPLCTGIKNRPKVPPRDPPKSRPYFLNISQEC